MKIILVLKTLLVFAIIAVIFNAIIAMTGCGQSRDMVTAAGGDLQRYLNELGVESGYSIRKEMLLLTQAGTQLGKDIDFVEIWNNRGVKAGWLYYEHINNLIRLIGYRKVDGNFHKVDSPWVRRVNLDKSKTKFKIIDGKEF